MKAAEEGICCLCLYPLPYTMLRYATLHYNSTQTKIKFNKQNQDIEHLIDG